MSTVPTRPDTICADCGALNSAERRRCRDCGASLRASAPRPSPSPPPPRPAAPSAVAADTGPDTFCAACGVLNSTTRSRCRECGAPLRPLPSAASLPDAVVYGAVIGEDEVVCRGCRRISPAEEEWCAGCGARLRLATPAAPPPVPAGGIRLCPRCRSKNLAGAAVCSDCGAALVRDGGGGAPAPEPTHPVIERTVVGLCCPVCGTTMEAGEALLGANSGRLMTLLSGSSSWLELFFRRTGERETAWVMEPDTPSPAARCTRCGGVWLAPQAARRT